MAKNNQYVKKKSPRLAGILFLVGRINFAKIDASPEVHIKKALLPTQNVGAEAVAREVADVTIVEVNEERVAGLIHVCRPRRIVIQGITKIFPKVISASTASTM